jgi:hypothetical protein
MRNNSLPGAAIPMNCPDEPLAESARLFRERAHDLCRRDPESGESCDWYHGIWQDLRLMGLAASPRHHSAFFPQALAMLARARTSPRILISGAADYSLLAHVLHACRQSSISADITVADICDTPLRLNDWYAESAGISIRTVRSDILDFRTDEPFDAIFSHSFLGQFAMARRARIVDYWRHLLVRGGAAVTINRIRPETLADPVAFSEQQIQTFLATVSDKSGSTGCDPALLLTRARIYAERLHAYAIAAPDLAALFTDRGYRIAHQSAVASATDSGSKARGLAIPAEAQHACLIAVTTS